MASSWALATSKVQATIFILWSDQLSRIALQREAGMLVFLYTLEIEQKKKDTFPEMCTLALDRRESETNPLPLCSLSKISFSNLSAQIVVVILFTDTVVDIKDNQCFPVFCF